MLFFINSRMLPGVTRDQVIEQCNRDVEKKNWELINRGVIAHWFFKVGKQPGIITPLNCDSMEEVRGIVNEALTVKDNGCGFDPDIVSQGGDSFVGFGILSMRERVEICKGDFKIQSTPGKGTFIENSIPI